jgi:hypothetical protein
MEEQKSERFVFNSGEQQRMEKHLEELTLRKEVIGLWDSNSNSFAEWFVIINEAVHDMMAKKQQLGIDCEKERKMLENISFLFTKMAFFRNELTVWHNELAVGVECTKKMVEDGHP